MPEVRVLDIVFLVLAISAGCTKRSEFESRDAASTTTFDSAWSALTQSGAETFRIRGDLKTDPGGALRARSEAQLNEQNRAVLAQKSDAGTHPVPAMPSSEAVQAVIRGEFPGIKYCYLRIRADTAYFGRAIISFGINPSGRTEGVRVDAPDFPPSKFSACVATEIALWRFPPSRQGAAVTSYPFEFLGN